MTSMLNTHPPAGWQQAVQQAAERLPDAARRASLAAFLAESASLAPQLMLHTLHRVAFTTPPGWQVASRCRELRIDPCFIPLLQRWHQQLEEEGWLEADQAGWQLSGAAPAEGALEQRIDDGKHRLRQLMSWLDESSVLSAALFGGLEQLDEWLSAPVLIPPPQTGLHQLLHLPGILDDYFSAMLAELLPVWQAEQQGDAPLLIACPHTRAFQGDWNGVRVDLQQPLAAQLPPGSRYQGALVSGLLSQASLHSLQELRNWLPPGAPLLLLENGADAPLHWVTPAALRAHSSGDSRCPLTAAADENHCRQALQQAGFTLLSVWPQPATPMAFCGQRLLLACAAPPCLL